MGRNTQVSTACAQSCDRPVYSPPLVLNAPPQRALKAATGLVKCDLVLNAPPQRAHGATQTWLSATLSSELLEGVVEHLRDENACKDGERAVDTTGAQADAVTDPRAASASADHACRCMHVAFMQRMAADGSPTLLSAPYHGGNGANA